MTNSEAPNISQIPFGDKLAQACLEKNSAVCVGLDPRWGSLPDAITDGIDANNFEAVAGATQCYCQEVIDAVAAHAPIIKPQAAFFELLGPAGLQALYQVIQYARKRGLLVLLDGKRGDIGSTAAGYAQAYLGQPSPWQCDALTVNPFLGPDTLEPFVETAAANHAGLFVLVKTSNPGSGFLQDLECEGSKVYSRIAAEVQSRSLATQGQSSFGAVGAVVGATYPDQLEELRRDMPNVWILIPGFGAQGGTADTVMPGFKTVEFEGTMRRSGAIVNSSRGIIFAYQQPKYADSSWQEAVGMAAEDMKLQLRG